MTMGIKWRDGGHDITKNGKTVRLAPFTRPGPDTVRESGAKSRLDSEFPENGHFLKIHADGTYTLLTMRDPSAVPEPGWWRDAVMG